jgi:chemotaxis protein histidine kinase CheA
MISEWEPHISDDHESNGQTYYYNDSYNEAQWNPVDFIQKEEGEVKDDIADPIDITTFDYHRLSDSGIYYNNSGKYVHYPTYKFELKGRFNVESGNPDTINIEFDKNESSSFITNSDETKIIFTDDAATDENLNRIFNDIMKTVAEDKKYEFKIKGLAVRKCGIVKLDILNVSSKTNGGNIYLYKLEIVDKKKILPEFIDVIIKANNQCRNENEKEKDEAEKQRVAAEKEAEKQRVEREAAEKEAEKQRLEREAAEKEAERQRVEREAAEKEAERQRLATEEAAAAERERQATLKAASDAAAAAERERLKTLETERDSWKTIYTPDNAIKWQKNNDTATFNPPKIATFEELVASKWQWTKITEKDGKVKIKWHNTVDQKTVDQNKGKRPDDIITDVVGQFPTIHNSPITEQAQTQQRAAAESALNAQSLVTATKDDPNYGKNLYKDWLNRHGETEQSIINRRAKIKSDNIYYFKTYIEKIKSQKDFYAVINEIKKAQYLENRTIKNRETFVSNASMQNAARIGEYFDHLLKKDVKNPAVSTILGLNQGGSSKTMKNHMKINKKTRKNVRDYATKGGTFTSKTRRSKKSKFRHTRKDKAR